MPEAPVDDHGHPPAGKDDIRPHTYAGDVDAVILVEAIAAGVQQGADLSLGAVFTRPVAGLAVCDAYDLGGWCVGTRSSAASTPRPGLAASSGARAPVAVPRGDPPGPNGSRALCGSRRPGRRPGRRPRSRSWSTPNSRACARHPLYDHQPAACTGWCADRAVRPRARRDAQTAVPAVVAQRTSPQHVVAGGGQPR